MVFLRGEGEGDESECAGRERGLLQRVHVLDLHDVGHHRGRLGLKLHYCLIADELLCARSARPEFVAYLRPNGAHRTLAGEHRHTRDFPKCAVCTPRRGTAIASQARTVSALLVLTVATFVLRFRKWTRGAVSQMSSQKTQPPRQTELIATEMKNKDHPEKPAVIEHPDTEAQLTSKRTMQDQKPALEERPTPSQK